MSKNNSTLEVITIGQIDVSKTNPRKHFDENALKELSESIREHGILQPILVRPILDLDSTEGQHFELVCGERRYRAAILAGLEDIPVNIRVLTDDEAFELQIVENLERKDVHPLDEADAFKKMIDSGKYTITDIAAKMAKAESFIAQRLKLVDLIDEVRTDFIAGHLGIGHAILIARSEPAKQLEIFNDAKPWGEGEPDYKTISELKETIESDSYELKDVIFDMTDENLVPGCGACTACPKRSGANPVLFADMADDRCFDEACFDAKEEAFVQKEVARIINDGEKTLILSSYSKPSDIIINICKQFDVKIHRAYDDFSENDMSDKGWEKVKGFCVSGSDGGKYIEVYLKPNVENPTSTTSTGAVSNEELEIKGEIQKIQDRQKRALELDGEKVWEKIRSTDKTEIKTKTNPLSQIELNALCFAMMDKLGYYGNNDVKKLVGDFEMDFARNGDFTNEHFNQISRIFFMEVLPSAYGSQDNVKSNHAYYKVIKEYYDGHVSDIEAEQKAIADKRIAKAGERIEALKASIKKAKPVVEETKTDPAETETQEVDFEEPEEQYPAVEHPNLFEKVTKKYALNNSYFKNRHDKAPATPLEVAQYFYQFGELPFEYSGENWLYDTYVEYQKRNSVYHSQFFTPPATAIQMAGLAHQYFDRESIVLDACSGFGALSKPLVEDGFKVVAFDFSKDMVDLYNMQFKFEGQPACEQLNFMEGEFEKRYFNIIANPPYEGPALTKFLECVHESLIDGGTAILLIPRGFVDKDKPKALVSTLEKFNVTYRIDMEEDFARTGIKAEIVVLEKV